MSDTTAQNSKPYYKEYTRESESEFLATDAYCWDVIDRKVRTREVVSEAGINTFIEHPDKLDPASWWVITTPNAGYIPMAPIGIRHIQAKADGCFGLDDRTLHPQMYVQSFEYICCIPKRDQSRRMLWWMPTLNRTLQVDPTYRLCNYGSSKCHCNRSTGLYRGKS